MRDMEKIHEFAIMYHALYENPKTDEIEVERRVCRQMF